MRGIAVKNNITLPTTVHADKNHINKIRETTNLEDDSENKVNYESKEREYADKRGIIFYEVKGNIMTYEEQVKDSRTSYGLYNAEVNLDTGVITQVKVG